MSNSFSVSGSEFVIGDDKFSELQIKDSGDGKFYYFYHFKDSRLIKYFVLGRQPRVMTLCEVRLIKKGTLFSPRFRVWKSSSVGSAASPIYEAVGPEDLLKVKASVDLADCHEAFWSLLDFLRSVKEVESLDGTFTVVEHIDATFIRKVASSFTTREAQELLIDAKKDDVQNLFASVRQAKNKIALEEFERLIAEDARELSFQSWFQQNSWAFGTEYLNILNTSRIGLHSDSDFIAQSLDGYHDLIELKRPSLRLLIHDPSHDNWFPSADLSKAIGQAVAYLHAMERSRAELEEEDQITVLKPRIKVIAGLMIQDSEKERRALRLINNGLHGIEIISYDQVVARARKLIEFFSARDLPRET